MIPALSIVVSALLLVASPQSPPEPADGPPPSGPLMNCGGPPLEYLDWMSGSWIGSEDGVESEEFWMPAAGGAMLGFHRDVSPDGSVFFEHLRIETDDAGRIVYQASPRGLPPTPFHAVSVGKGNVEFANPENDFPKRIRYRLDADGRLCARIAGDAEDPDRAREWCWTRASSP